MLSILLVLFMFAVDSAALATDIPEVLRNIYAGSDGRMIFVNSDGDTLFQVIGDAEYTLSRLRTSPVGTDDGIRFDFGDTTFGGQIHYGFLQSPSEMKYSYPVFFNRTARIDRGVAEIDVRNRMSGKYDFVSWNESGQIRFGYRIFDNDGNILYDGKIRLTGKGPFAVDSSIVEGPFVNLLTDQSAVISFETNVSLKCSVSWGDGEFFDDKPAYHHEISISGLKSDTEYPYTVNYGSYSDTYSFRTAPLAGTRKPFTFGYASDGRANNGGGERDIYGVNAYILKRIAVVCSSQDARFLQFTGDLVSGYSTDEGDIDLQYANWKRTVEPYACYMPFIAGIGNHEMLEYYFHGEKGSAYMDKFPYETSSSETAFARNFVNPRNGPVSEDGAVYDPNENRIDFPPYSENCFYYTYDNVAMISLNSNYWYSSPSRRLPEIGGNLHGYIMEKQMAWLKETLAEFEADSNIDHVFVTLHTPIFPNGGHVGDDMWYSGNNEPRAWVAGKPLKKGIIENRDELLDLLTNKSTKVKATLAGDEHNYSLLRIDEITPIYPDDWTGKRINVTRPFWQIVNGAAGAPYYGREVTPWMEYVRSFSTQNALVLFHVNGKDIRVEVINPDTMEKLDEFSL